MAGILDQFPIQPGFDPRFLPGLLGQTMPQFSGPGLLAQQPAPAAAQTDDDAPDTPTASVPAPPAAPPPAPHNFFPQTGAPGSPDPSVAAQPQPSFIDRLTSLATNPQNDFFGKLTAIGAGIAGGRNIGEGFANGLSNYHQQRLQDAVAQQQQVAALQKQQQIQGRLSLVQQAYPNLSPQQALGIATNDTLFQGAAEKVNPGYKAPIATTAGTTLIDPRTLKPVFTNPKDDKAEHTQNYAVPGENGQPILTGRTTDGKTDLTTGAPLPANATIAGTGYGANSAATPSTVSEYNFYAKQEKDAGRAPVSFLDYQTKKGARFANFDTSGDHQLISSLAARALAGDRTWKTGLARNPGLIQAVEAEVARGGEPGDVANRILQNQANQVGRAQEQRTLGTASASNTLYGNAAASTMDTAIQASRDLPRTTFVPINKLIQMSQDSISDPKLARFRAATQTLVNDYSKATTPVGTPTDAKMKHAYEMLNLAQSPEAFEAVVDIMRQEVANTHTAIGKTKTDLGSGAHGDVVPTQLPTGGPTVPGSQSQGVFDTIKGLFSAAPPGPRNPGLRPDPLGIR